MIDFAGRRSKLVHLIQQSGAKGLLVTNPVNVTYLTGFTGHDSYLIVARESCLLISDPRYEEQIGEECPGLQVYIRSPAVKLPDATTMVLKKCKLNALLIEGDSMSVNLHQMLQSALKSTSLAASSGLVESLRLVKDRYEIAAIRRAVVMAERVFTSIRAGLRSDYTEIDIANEIERQVRQVGGRGTAFSPIVAVGERAALPHAVPTVRKISESPFVLIDWGAIEGLYRSDLTRVLSTGKLPQKFTKIYQAVLAAQQAAIEAIRPGVLASEIDAIARAKLSDFGLESRFNHGLGHGIGLDIHEAPRLGKNQPQELVVGMVVTVEPGVYFPGWGGVRIEDDVLITRDGCEILSSLPRDMEANCVELLA